MRTANACILSFPKLNLKEVLIFGGEQSYTFLSESNIIYEIKLEHIVNYYGTHDQYYDPEFIPTKIEHDIINEEYTSDSCQIKIQSEFSIAAIKALPKNGLKLTEIQMDEIKNQFKATNYEKYNRKTSKLNKRFNRQIKDTIINNVYFETYSDKEGRKLLNSYFNKFKTDSIYTHFWNNQYWETILSNGDIINILDSNTANQELLGQYIYLDSSRDDCIGCCGVGHQNDIVACIYLKE